MPEPKRIRELTPGEIYKGIPMARTDFEGIAEKRLVKRAQHPFVLFCKRMHRFSPGMGRGAKFEEKFRDAIEFLDWDLNAEQFSAAVKLTLLFSLVGLMFTAFLIDSSPISQVLQGLLLDAFIVKILIYLPFLAASLLLTQYVQNFPLNEVKLEQTRALTFVPEIMGYMIMSMKLVPNLEKAVEFSAEHGRGKVADDFKRIIWDTQLGTYSTLSEGMDRLAYSWGKYSEEFKRSLMMIRASVLENTEAKRYQLLDKTMATILDSIRNKMEDYARNLQEPSQILFNIGLLLPLILLIILPVGSAFSGQPFAKAPVLVFIYNILIPVIVLVYARRVVKGRPPTYEPPQIPDNYPGLPKKGHMALGNSQIPIIFAIALILASGTIFSFFLSLEGIPPKSIVGKEFFQIIPYDKTNAEVLAKAGRPENYFEENGPFYTEQLARGSRPEEAKKKLELEKLEFFSKTGNDTTPYAIVFGLMITISLCVFVYLYHTFIYRRKIQQQIVQLESEFKDSLYILASRLGENKPVEEAMRHTKEFLPTLSVSERVFGRTVENIELLGMPLEAAVFDPMYGSMKNIPSSIIRSSMRLLIDSVQLGVNLAARTLISLSLQLSNAEQVTRMLSVLVSDVTSTMKTMSVFIAPIILGIVVALQKVVIKQILAVGKTSFSQASAGGVQSSAVIQTGIQVPSLAPISFELATPLEFLIIVAIYVLELIIIMSYFTTKIEEDNNLLVWINTAKSIPIAMTLFLLSTIASNAIVSGFLGG